MNSSLPNFSAVPVPATGAAPLNAATLAGLGTLTVPGPSLPGEFADLLATDPAATASLPTAVPVVLPVPSPLVPAVAACPTVVVAPTTSVAFANAPVAVAVTPAQPVATPASATVTAVPVQGEGIAPVDAGEAIPAADEPAPAISRDTLEQAATFVASFLQSLWPELATPVAPAPTGEAAPAPAAPGPVAGAALASTATSLPLAKPAPASPAQPAVGPEFAVTADPATAPSAAPAAPEAPAFAVALAADGVVEIKLDATAGAKVADRAPAAPAPIELHAELELPGQAVLRLSATGSEPRDFASFTAGAKFAGKNPAARGTAANRADAAERNFVFTGDKRVKAASPEAGITVAKKDPIMSAAPIEETRATRPSDFSSVTAVRADFQVVPPPAERITAPATAPAGQNFAERAVATVTGLVDAQFSASMQRSGSVNLRLKFGGEDLSVRVELRGGAVHTDFQTDSPELRAALTREWQALTNAAPAELRRYHDPVFSPASASTSTGTGDGQSQSSGRQAQQQAAQQDLPQRPAREFAEIPTPFSRRSSLNETFSPAPVEPRTPAFLPTSLRLSALA